MTQRLTPRPIDVPEADLEDLRQRLSRTRWPEKETVDDWSQGIPLAYVQDVCRTWEKDYDWRACERRLNSYQQLRFAATGPGGGPLGIQVLNAPSTHRDAMPLVLTHGWPGSVVEFLEVIEPLRDPTKHGGSPEDAFHVVCPSLPGYGWSERPAETGWTTEHIAGQWVELMAALGHDRFAAQGGDWGSAVTTALGANHPDQVLGIHLNMVAIGPGRDPGELTEAEQESLKAYAYFEKWGTGYSKQQSTKPQTLGYGLTDSPAGQAAWILEKFSGWSEIAEIPDQLFDRHRLLDNVMHYWLPGTATSSARLYWESYGSFGRGKVDVPTGVAIFPRELIRPSRRWAERRFSDIRQWNELGEGGHFAAFEQPAVFIDEVRAFFRGLR